MARFDARAGCAGSGSRRRGVRALVSQWDELYDQFTAEVLDYFDADPWVVCDTRWHGKGAGSGVPVEVRSADAYEVREGKIARSFGGFLDVASALEAVRLAQ